MKNKKVLLIIDMQKGSFTPETPRFDTEGVVMRINELAQLFRRAKLPVIYIQHDGTGTGEFEKNTTEWEILESLNVESTDILIDKYANDVFYNSKLQSKLIELNATELLITGCATDFCVESTIQSALTKDYNITVVSNGHTTGERPHLKAKKVIEHYNWVWKNMIPTKGKIEVKSLEEIKNDTITKTIINTDIGA
jgi:nicotinamidase-related amidase